MKTFVPLLRQNKWMRSRRGYVMLVAMLMLVLLSLIGTSTLNIAGIDYQIAIRNRKHMLVLNTASAGNEDARHKLQTEQPVSEGFTANGYEDTVAPEFIDKSDAETNFEGLNYPHNLGAYFVEATFHRCGNPPPGYSTELGRNGFRADYWEMESTGRMMDTTGTTNQNATEAITSTMVRMVMKGSCKVR